MRPQAIFFWVEIFFLGGKRCFLYTRIPPFKNAHREVLKKCLHIFFRPNELKIVQKKRFLVQIWAPEMAKNGQNGSFWPLFGDFRDFLRKEPLTLNPTSPWTPKIVFEVPWDLSVQKTPSGSSILGELGVGAIFEAAKR